MRTLSLAVAAVIGVVGLAASAGLAQDAVAEKPKPSRFADVVGERFASWDLDSDGAVSAGEIDKACVNAAIRGAEAAAVAAIKRVVRSDRYELPRLTRDYLLQATGRRATEEKTGGENADRADSGERARSGGAAKITTRPNFQRGFDSSLNRITKTDRAVFGSDGEPSIEHCHQGPLGDCFFVSVVGGIVKRDAGALKRMISERPESEGGGYTVRFGDGQGRAVSVSPLTDAELAISSTASDREGDEGLWLAVLEKAFGTSRREDNPGRYGAESATDAIAKGGSTATSIRLLTGHVTERITLKKWWRWELAEQYDADRRLVTTGAPGTNAPVRMQPAEDVRKLEAKVRAKVSGALKAGRLVAVGTGEEKQPPGISGKHAYAVLAFDEAADAVTLWNPHGNTYSVRGEKGPGLGSGYATKGGIFQMPVSEFVRVFSGVTIETERAAGGAGALRGS